MHLHKKIPQTKCCGILQNSTELHPWSCWYIPSSEFLNEIIPPLTLNSHGLDALNSFCRSAHCTARSETCGGSSKSHVLAASSQRMVQQDFERCARVGEQPKRELGSYSFWKMRSTSTTIFICLSSKDNTCPIWTWVMRFQQIIFLNRSWI